MCSPSMCGLSVAVKTAAVSFDSEPALQNRRCPVVLVTPADSAFT